MRYLMITLLMKIKKINFFQNPSCCIPFCADLKNICILSFIHLDSMCKKFNQKEKGCATRKKEVPMLLAKYFSKQMSYG